MADPDGSAATGRAAREAVDGAACGFHFTDRMRTLCGDVVARVAELRHIQLDRVAITFSRSRKPAAYGLYATLTPLRFEGGRRFEYREGRCWTVQRVTDAAGREMLYILSFYLPRFLDLDFREKLVTIFHELWHISPQFDGDLRRHAGRCYAHTHSQQQYDAQVAVLADRWLSEKPPRSLYDFLECDFDTIVRRHGRLVGARLKQPKVIPLWQRGNSH